MQMVVVSIFDIAAGVYSRPVFVGSKGLAVRSFQDECRRVAPDGGNAMNSHPEDFNLFLLGTFDDVTGKFCNEDLPALLFRGSDCK